MIKIITALENEKLNKKIKEDNKIEVIGKDIQYKEGILELLEQNNTIDFIILDINIKGNIKLNELIKKIKEINNNIKIILIINKKDNIEKYKQLNLFYKILYINELKLIINNKNDINKNIQEKINKKKQKNIKLNKIKKLKNIKLKNKISEINKKIKKTILNYKNLNNNKNKINYKKINIIFNNIKNKKFIIIFRNIFNRKLIYKKINKKINNISEKENNKKNFIIYIAGANGTGKSTITVLLAKVLSCMKKNILIIDLNFNNKSIHTILGAKIISENNIFKINKKIHLFSPNELMLENNEIIKKINSIIKEQKNYYDYILIDSNLLNNYFLFKFNINIDLINLSNLLLIISGCNLLEINKTKNLLKKLKDNLNINLKKIKIIFNKYNNWSININILKIILEEINIIGLVKYNEKFELLINKNLRKLKYFKKTKKIFFNIAKNLEKIERSNSYGNRK